MSNADTTKLVMGWLLLLLEFALIWILVPYFFGNKEIKHDVEQIDTLYHKVILDSIEYNIRKKDSIIYEYKKELVNNVEEVKSASVDDVVSQFKQLAGSN